MSSLPRSSRSQRVVAIVYALWQLASPADASPFFRSVQQGEAEVSALDRRQISNPTPSNFIRRALHASVVVGNHVYIDGGELAQYIDGNTDTDVSRVNNNTLSIDLSSSWTNQTVQVQSLNKGNAPAFNFPGLWPDGNGAFYLFSGEVSPVAGNVDTPDVALWKFTSTPSGGGSWSKENPTDPQVFNQLTRPANALVAHTKDTGYVLGGYTSGKTDPNVQSGDVPVPGIVSYNWANGQWSNSSADAFTTYGTAVSGKMHYVPTFGNNGLLFMFGGETTTPTAWKEDSGQLQFNNLTFYDPVAGKWYSQMTTGDAPPVRELFCVTGTEGKNDTYEIFVMGGWDAFHQTCYDDMYVLSLPGFNWFKVPATSGSPRAFHTCNVVGNRQMLVIGGVNYGKGIPGDWKDPDPWSQGLGVFDMTNLSWSSGYDADAAAYESPQVVKSWYKQGNANSVSWTSPAIRTLFATTNSNSGSSSSSSSSGKSSSSHSHTGAIIGGVVGGVVGLAFVAGAVFLVCRRRRQRRQSKRQSATAPPSVPEKMQDGQVHEAGGGGGGAAPPQYYQQQDGKYYQPVAGGGHHMAAAEMDGQSTAEMPASSEVRREMQVHELPGAGEGSR